LHKTRTGHQPKVLKLVLTGNPNSGKTTIFNHLTGFRQRVGNYPGVTVEKKEGEIFYNGFRIRIVDLPGIYSLTAYSLEELISRKVILEEKPDVVVDVVDATNLERSLYLATQLMELGTPLVLALNMSDEAKALGIQFDLDKLSSLLGVSIVPTVGHKREGIEKLLAAVVEVGTSPKLHRRIKVNYGRDIEAELEKLEKLIQEENIDSGRFDSRWLEVKILERDQDVLERIGNERLLTAAHEAARRIEGLLGDSSAIIMADRRYGFISGACQEAVKTTVESRHTVSDKIDEVLTSELLGIPILLLMMYAVFHFTFTLGEPPMQMIEYSFGRLAQLVSSFWSRGSESLLKSLLVDGLIGGVGGVIVFLPNILLLFLAIALLEDTGYMARAAFIMDRLMHKIGLHGKSFIPLLIGFGCSVPAIMATRTLENRRDRLLTMLIIPLMSCGARLPIYALIIPAFFPQAWQAPMLWMIYVIGVLLAVALARLLSKTVLKGSSEPFVMELPPYRMPTGKSVLIHMWERGRLYLKKAGTLILSISIVLWALTAFPRKKDYSPEYSVQLLQAQRVYNEGVQQLGRSLGLSPAGIRLFASTLQESFYEEGSSMPEPEGVSPQESKFIERFVQLLKESREKGIDPAQGGDPASENEGFRKISEGVSYYLRNLKQPYQESLVNLERLKRHEQLTYSMAGRIGRALELVLKPLGFDWKISTALIGAFAAKEVFVAQMGIIYAVESTGERVSTLREKIRADYSPLVGVCILLFCLIGTPCMATLAVTSRE